MVTEKQSGNKTNINLTSIKVHQIQQCSCLTSVIVYLKGYADIFMHFYHRIYMDKDIEHLNLSVQHPIYCSLYWRHQKYTTCK